ncbi:MAG: hypothetical protein ACK55Z_33065, partial [bacterium]
MFVFRVFSCARGYICTHGLLTSAHTCTQALLAASGRVREMQDKEHLAGFGIEVGEVKYDRQKVADHAANLVSTVAKNLGGSLTALG